MEEKLAPIRRQLTACRLLVALLLPLSGCAYNLIAPYDSALDTTMTQVQHDTELFFNQLQDGHDVSYESSKDFYVRTEATLRTLLTRAQAVPKSHLVADQISKIESTLERVQSMHKRDQALSAENITSDRETLESEFRSFFRLELALKTHLGSPPGAAVAPSLKN